jgi:general secretion pathway protein M
MPFSLPTGRLGQLSAVGILLAALLVLWLGAISPVAALYHARAQALSERRVFAEKMAEVAAQLPALRVEVATVGHRLRPAHLLFAGATDALSSAEMQETLEKMATTAGVGVLSVDSVPAKNVGPVRRVGLRFSLSGKYAAVVRFLVAVAGSVPPMLIDDLQIEGPGGDSEGNVSLLANLTVYAFRGGDRPS